MTEIRRPGNEFARMSPAEKQRFNERWAKAPYTAPKYPGGTAVDADGQPYTYESGRMLWVHDVGGKDVAVMDTSERPWASLTAHQLLYRIGQARRNTEAEFNAPRILELGWGLGLTTEYLLTGLHGGTATNGRAVGGYYECVELNEGIADFAQKELSKKLQRFRGMSGMGSMSASPRISARVVQGEAIEVLAERAQQIKKGEIEPFDGILSDLVNPYITDGTVDLQRLDLIRACLTPRGRLAHHAYYPGYTQFFTSPGAAKLANEGFMSDRTDFATIYPNPNNPFLYDKNDAGKPLRAARSLPVVISKINPELAEPAAK